MFTFHMMWAWATAQAKETSHSMVRGERGASTLELVIISALVAALCIAAIAILRSKVMGAANSIPTN